MRVALDRQVTFAFALALALLIALSAVAYRGIGTLVSSLDEGRIAYDALAELEEALLLVVDVDVEQRSYEITGDGSLPVTVEAARRRSGQQFVAIRSVAASQPELEPGTREIEALVSERLDLAERALAARSAGSPPPSDGRTAEITNRVRTLVRETRDAVTELERDRSRVSSEAALMSLSVIVATGLASVVFLYLARFVIVRELRRRQRAERALQRLNLDLEGIVAERTEDLTRANEELHVEIRKRHHIEAEREELLAREQEARQQAEEANRLKDEFVATISHELRAPLNAILGWVRLLRAGKLATDDATKALDTIERSANSQARLIDDLLDISRIITGKLRLDVRTVDPNAVIRSAIEAVGPAADARSIALDVDLDRAVGVISGDPNRLQQIIWNLLSNAIKFTPKGGRVRVESARVSSQVTIMVSDNGQGIAPEFLPHVFDRFRQGDSSSSRRHGGLGLGLSIVRHLVEMHGGTVRASSQGAGKGATFTVTLPVLPLRIRQPQPTSSAQRPSERKTPVGDDTRLDGLLVLVVDDEEDGRQMLTQMLALYGATVIAAGSAAEALSVLSLQQPDVMVSDVGMPGEDGYALIRKVRSRGLGKDGNLPAIALTAYAQPKDRMQALAAGFQHHVRKPADPNELVTVIASLTGRLHDDSCRRT